MPDFTRLKPALIGSGIQQKNAALYQVINTLLTYLGSTPGNTLMDAISGGGTVGPPGPAGASGTSGILSVDGYDGIDGLDGPPGMTGPIGPTGPAGPSGSSGISGMPGLDGIDGISNNDLTLIPSISQLLDLIANNPTQGSILFRDANFWNLLPPGLANYLLQTNGVNANPSWANFGTLPTSQIAYVTLNASQLQSLNTVPVTIVSAPGSGIVVVPVAVFFKGVRSGTAFVNDSIIRIQWSGITTVLFQASDFVWNSVSAATLFRQPPFNTSGFSGSSSDDPRNQPLQAVGTQAMTGGTGSTCSIAVVYNLATGF